MHEHLYFYEYGIDVFCTWIEARYGDLGIAQFVKNQQIRWAEHVETTTENRIPKMKMKGQTLTEGNAVDTIAG